MSEATIVLSAEPAVQTAPITTEAQSAPQTAANAPWYSGIQNEPTRVWAEAKGWKDPLAAVESAYNLEKLIGFDKAGRTVVMPNDDSTPEQRAAFNTKMGVPDSVDGYKLAVPDGTDPKFSKSAAKWFHDNGVSAKAAEGIVNNWNTYQAEMNTKINQAKSVEQNQEFGEIKAEWGKAYDERIELTRRGMVEFLPAASAAERATMMDKIESAIGTKNFLKFGYAMGAGLIEHKMHGGGQTSSILTPAQATQKIAELKSNKEWTAAYLEGDKSKIKEMGDLFEMINAGNQS